MYGLVADSNELANKLAACKDVDTAERAIDMLAHPSTSRFWKIVSCVDDRDLVRITVQAVAIHPGAAIAAFVRNLEGLTVGPPKQFSDATWARSPALFFPISPQTNDPHPANLHITIGEIWLKPPIAQSDKERMLDSLFSTGYGVIAPTSFLLMLIGVFGSMRLGWAPMTIVVIYAGHILPMAALVDPQFRYQVEMAPLLIAGAGFGLSTLWRSEVAKLFRPVSGNAGARSR
jgi:hypothetical protein